MSQMLSRSGLKIAEPLAQFVERDVLPGLGIDADSFWSDVAAIFDRFAPENRRLLDIRDTLQAKIDAWHKANPGPIRDMAGYQAFLRDIGYLIEEPQPFTIGTERVDAEIAGVAGPQLVVPVLNARFLLNAANAR